MPAGSSIAVSIVMAAASLGLWRNRMTAQGRWSDRGRSEDAHGRAIWGMGATMAGGATSAGLVRGWTWRQAGWCWWPPGQSHTPSSARPRRRRRSGMGAAERIIERYLERRPIPRPGRWRRPEDRLTYANARIPQAMIVAGDTMDRAELIADGLDLLEWLGGGGGGRPLLLHPGEGQGLGRERSAFDQQPIEAWAMADACAVAGEVTHDASGGRDGGGCRVVPGRNDGSRLLVDSVDGACSTVSKPTGSTATPAPSRHSPPWAPTHLGAPCHLLTP